MSGGWRGEGPEPSLRRLGPEDLDDLYRVESLCFSHPWSKEAYGEELAHNQLARYFGCYIGEELVAFGGYWLIVDEGHVTNVAVRPDHQRQGLGAWLMAHMTAACLREGGRKMTLEVRESNVAARSLYEKLGYVCLGRRRGYYDQPQEDALILWWE